MNGRERIMTVLNRKPADRIPLDLGGTDCSAVHVLPYKKLRKSLGLKDQPVICGCLTQLIAENDRDFTETWDVDAEVLGFGAQATRIWKAPFGVDLIVPAKFNVETLPDGTNVVKNAAGAVYSQRAADAYYFDPAGTPLAGITSAAELKNFDTLFERWDYSAVYDEPLDKLAARAQKQYQATSRAVVALWRMHYLQAGQLMRGYEQFMIDLMIDKDLAHAILRKLHEAYLKRTDALLAAVGDSIDIVFLTDDLGTQESGLVSPEIYREMIFPYTRELVGKIKAAGKKVVMHSCGAVAKFIPYLIEAGVDALNPVQVSAKGMDPVVLVREFGKDIAFWGGGCDTQHALNSPDLNVVRADVRRRLQEFKGGHQVFTQVHNIQYDVPPQNIAAMRDEFLKLTRS
jgi:uroporphyrinogen decarboxylase